MEEEVEIRNIVSITPEGVAFELTVPAQLNGGISTKQWYVSWDRIGRSLFKDQYSDAISVDDLQIERKEI